MLTGLVFMLAILTWKYVEQPFRNRSFLTRKQIFAAALAFSLSFIGFGLVGYFNNGFLNRLSATEQAINDYRNHGGDWRREVCFLGLEPEKISFAPECYASGDHRQIILLWGDSHAAALYSGIRKKSSQVTQLTAAGCPPVLNHDYDGTKSNKKCIAANSLISKFIKDKKPGKIFLHAVWDGYTDDKILEGLAQTLTYINAESPESKVYVIGPVPQWKPTLPDVALRKHVTLDQESYLKMPLYNKLSKVEANIKMICDRYHVQYLSPFARMCKKDQCLVVGQIGASYALTAFDYGHLTKEGADILAEYIFSYQ